MSIVYGFPGPELLESSIRGEVFLGGGATKDDPAWCCMDCEHEE